MNTEPKSFTNKEITIIVLVIAIVLAVIIYRGNTSQEPPPPELHQATQEQPAQPYVAQPIKVVKDSSVTKKPLHEAYADPEPSPAPSSDPSVDGKMKSIYEKVAYNAEQQFFIAKRQGDNMQIYVQAQMVCAAYLQAQDEESYRKWKKVEAHYKRKIGL